MTKNRLHRLMRRMRKAFASDAAVGLVLMVSAALALYVANSGWSDSYFHTLEMKLGKLTLLEWINDAVMVLFFLFVGLEIKRELISGHLSTWKRRALPGIAAFGGMIMPALVYLAFTARQRTYMSGWAIPSATDIAFALGVLALAGKGLPSSLRIFLAALAIVDDLGAIIIIALFYTVKFSGLMLGAAGCCLAILIIFNLLGVRALWPYLLTGIPLWVFTLQSGVHATLSGVMLAATIPLRTGTQQPPLLRLEHTLAPLVSFLVLPVFGFANAGVSLAGAGLQNLLHPVTMGVAAGLFIGKQIGIYGCCRAAVALGWANLPKETTWLQIYGVALICGVGFTMSLFVALLAFPDAPDLVSETKTGVLLGSTSAALAGALVLHIARNRLRTPL